MLEYENVMSAIRWDWAEQDLRAAGIDPTRRNIASLANALASSDPDAEQRWFASYKSEIEESTRAWGN